MIYIVAGVAGSGKTTVGKLLAEKINLPFYDADDFHPVANIEKMRIGIALNDSDRVPWLNILAEKIISWQKEGGAVLACSALKETYRQSLMTIPSEQITWIFLTASKTLIENRLGKRSGHFFNVQLLKSQFEALEIPDYGLHLDASLASIQLVNQIPTVGYNI